MSVDIFRGVAGEGSDDLDLVPGQIFRQPAVIFLFHDGEIAPVNDVGASLARDFNEVTKELAQLGRATGDVHDRRPIPANPVTDAMGRRLVHHLRPPRAGIDMAMTAGLIALAPDVDLKGFQARAAQSQIVAGQSLFKAIHESGERIAR